MADKHLISANMDFLSQRNSLDPCADLFKKKRNSVRLKPVKTTTSTTEVTAQKNESRDDVTSPLS